MPKGAVYSHGNFSAQVELLRQIYDIRPGEIDLPTFPLFALFAPALGMTSVVPEMDFTRPADVDPAKIIAAIEKFQVTTMFGSPALINRVGRYGEAEGIKLPSLKRAISAGAPVPASVLERFAGMLQGDAQLFTPYGATEALPVCSIGSDEILDETRHATDRGRGVCVGRPVPGIELEIIRISDEPIAQWSDDLKIADGEIGEIVVKGPQVTGSYFNRAAIQRPGKIADPAARRFLPPHGRSRLPRRTGAHLVLRPQGAPRGHRGRDPVYDPLRGDFQYPSGGVPHRPGRCRRTRPAAYRCSASSWRKASTPRQWSASTASCWRSAQSAS